MKKRQAMAIHAYLDASWRISGWLCAAAFFVLVAAGASLGDAVLGLSWSIAFIAILAAVSTDLRSMRIPNQLSLLLLAAGVLRWIAEGGLGAAFPSESDGVVRALMSFGAQSGTFIPSLSLGFAGDRILLDVAAMLIVFAPLYASCVLRLGFGGGDVKLITAASLFFGWPLAFDFLLFTFVVGGLLSAGFLLARKIFHMMVRFPDDSRAIHRALMRREFPYAPAIAISAIVCLASLIEGLVR